ncbi:MAG: TerC family protein, partial [Candidatus Methanomethylophilaceae archaeon]
MLEESPLLWLGFIVLVVILLALDLGVLNRGSHHISVKKALYLTAFWISIAIVFGIFVFLEMGEQKGMEYFTGYIIEKAMSVDNLFVFILIF